MYEYSMGVTDTSAALITARRRQLALFTWRNNNGFPKSVVQEQAPSQGFRGTGPTGDVPLNVFVGAQLVGQQSEGTCACSTNVTLQGYVKQGPGSCGSSF